MKKENKAGIEAICKILPDEWETKAQELGALRRSRVIKNAVELIVLLIGMNCMLTNVMTDR